MKYNNEIVWLLPCFFQHEPMIGALKQCVKKIDPELDFKTKAYGAPASVWTGEMMPDNYDKLDKITLELVYDYYNEIQTTPIFSFVSTQITKDNLSDEYANYILDSALENNCEFLVYSDELKNHIKEKKQEAIVIASWIKAIEQFQKPNSSFEQEAQFYNEQLKEYDLVDLRPEFVKSYLIDNPGSIDDLSRVEVITSYPCAYNCSNCLNHIKHYEGFSRQPGRGEPINCPIPFMFVKDFYKQNPSLTSAEIEKLFNCGVRNFKIDKNRREPVIPIDLLMHKVATQIFNSDGANYLLFSNIIQEQIMYELEYFSEKFFQSEYYRKVYPDNV